MKVARIDTIPLAIPHDSGGPPPAWGGRAWDALNILLVRVETEGGGVGWWEAYSTRLEATLYPGFVSPVDGGRFRVPAGPGLGAEPDPDVIREYRVQD